MPDLQRWNGGGKRIMLSRSVLLLLILMIAPMASAFTVPHSALQKVVQSVSMRSQQRPKVSLAAAWKDKEEDSGSSSNKEEEDSDDATRRQLFRSSFVGAVSLAHIAIAAAAVDVEPAHAVLMQFPAPTLKNRYHFMRAGMSELEADNIFETNALFLTNDENRLVGVRNIDNDDSSSSRSSSSSSRTDQPDALAFVRQACDQMRNAGQSPTVVYHSLAMHGMNTGDAMAIELQLGRDRLLPEFTYLDPRGIGLWDASQMDTTIQAMAALDFAEAGPLGTGGRPPANTDGTPNETLGDQFIRLRQFLSLQESRTSGENILVIFPDGTGPALLSCMIAGLPYSECHCLAYAPGEIRLDITAARVRNEFRVKREDPAYLRTLEQGQVELEKLRQQGKQYVGRKEVRNEERRLQLEDNFARGQQEQQQQSLQRQQQQQQQQQEAEQQLAAERAQAAQERQAQAERKRQQEAELKQRQIAERQQAQAQERARQEQRAAKAQTPSDDNNKNGLLPMVAATVAVVGVGAAVASGGGGEAETAAEPSVPTTPTNGSAARREPAANATEQQSTPAVAADSLLNATTVADVPNGVNATMTAIAADDSDEIDEDILLERPELGMVNMTMTTKSNNAVAERNGTNSAVVVDAKETPGKTNDSASSTTPDKDNAIDEEDAALDLANSVLFSVDGIVDDDEDDNGIVEEDNAVAVNTAKPTSPQSSGGLFDEPVPVVTQAKPSKSVDGDDDDSMDEAWLRVVAEIRDEEEGA